MAITSITQLQSWFSKEKKPTQAQFWAWLDSFFHKDEKIHVDNIEGLPTALPALGGNADTLVGKTPSDFASAEQGKQAEQAKPYTDEKIGEETLEKVAARGNTTSRPLHVAEGNVDENAATLRQLRFECSEVLSAARTEIAALRGSGTMTHDTLKKASEAIDTLLAVVESDNADLDTVREIVAFIKGNKDVIDSISTSKLDKSAFNTFVEQMGSELQSLSTALAGKAASSHTHSKSQITDFPTSLPASDVHAWAKAASKPSYTAAEVGAAGANHTHTKAQITDFPTSLPASDVPAWAKAASKPNYTAAEVGAAGASHTHTKVNITDFPTSLPASDVPTWAKAASKPTYNASEVGALPSSGTITVNGETKNLKDNPSFTVSGGGGSVDPSTPWQTTGNIMNYDGGDELYLTYRINKAGLAEVFMLLNPQSTSYYANCNWPRLISLSEGFSAMSQVMGAWSSDVTCTINWGGISAGEVNPYFDYYVSDPADSFMMYLCYQPS